jgi:phosphonate transport system substrate-binding protein
VKFTRRAFVASAAAISTVSIIPRGVRAADDLHVAFIPEVATTSESITAKAPFVDWLAKATGRNVKLIIPTNYAATIEAVGNGSVDVAHFGGLSFLKAQARYGVQPLVQRTRDQAFHSLFITNVAGINALTDLKSKSFAFGDVLSTSGHLIPAKEMLDAGVDPDHDVVARFSGNHTNTALAVNSGRVQAGALDELVYGKMVADKVIDPAKARVFHTSAPFADYVWTAGKSVDAATAATITNAFIALKDGPVYALLGNSPYVKITNAEYDNLRAVANKLQLL